MKSKGDENKQYLVQGEYTVEYLRDGAWRTMSRNKHLESHGLDQTLLNTLEMKILGKNTFVGFTRAIVIDDDGNRYSYNAHPSYQLLLSSPPLSLVVAVAFIIIINTIVIVNVIAASIIGGHCCHSLPLSLPLSSLSLHPSSWLSSLLLLLLVIVIQNRT